jgi:hypothetical protein
VVALGTAASLVTALSSALPPRPQDSRLRVTGGGAPVWSIAGETRARAGDEFRSSEIHVADGVAVVRLQIFGEVARGGIAYRLEDEGGRLIRPDGERGQGVLTDCALAVRVEGRRGVRLVLANPVEGAASRWNLSRVEVRSFTEAGCPGCARRLRERFDLGRSAWLWAWDVLRRPIPRGSALPLPECACGDPWFRLQPR